MSPASDLNATTRLAKALLLAGVALFFTLVVFNNLTDFGSNYQFVRHVLLMDTTFPGNRGLWRALHPAVLHLAFYVGIIAWEGFCAGLGWLAAIRVFRARRGSSADVVKAARLAVAALTAGMLLWLVAFLIVGGEWFLMWQSRLWNGQEAAFRMFAVEGIVLIFVLLPEGREPGAARP